MADLPDRATPQQALPAVGNPPKTPSCVMCANRKVKCDRKSPCATCTKRGFECIYQAPAPPRRRKRRPSGDVHAFSRPSPARSGTGFSGPARHAESSPAAVLDRAPTTSQAESGVLITGAGRSVYMDNNVWTSVRNELPRAEEMTESDSMSSLDDEHDEVFMLLDSSKKKSLTSLHPSPLHIFKLWQTFLQNVNPLIKLLHVPTAQQQILEATEDLTGISKEFEALMFSIYCLAVVSLNEKEVQDSFGEQKNMLLSRYRRGTQLALAKAGILRTSSMVVLQAFLLFLLAMRAFSDSESIWSLCGVAVRMAQRIGLHRDGAQHGLSVFDTEMRRRLWLQLIILDATTAQGSGITSQTSLMRSDVRRPSNVNDSDLDPRMAESPREHDGATEMIFCLMRNEFGEWLERWSKVNQYSNGIWGFLSSPSLSLAKKDEAINELGSALETKFLRHCDRSIPLHLMTSIVVQTIMCHMRLAAHHPRQYSNGENVDQKERDYMFSICLQMVENSVAAQTSTVIQRYTWHVENHAPWDACIHMLYELGHRVHDEETARAWHLLDEIYRYHYWQMKNRPKNSLYIAMRKLLVKAWNAHTEERIRQKKPTLPRPWIISKLAPGTKTQEVDNGSGIASFAPPKAAPEVVQGSEQPAQGTPLGVSQEIDFGGDIEDLELSPMDWGQWDDLLQQFTNSDAWGE